jgi:hypothetical protein
VRLDRQVGVGLYEQKGIKKDFRPIRTIEGSRYKKGELLKIQWKETMKDLYVITEIDWRKT